LFFKTNIQIKMAPSTIGPSERTSATLNQPWKAIWPPSDEQVKQPFTGLGFEKSQKIVMDGTSVFPSTATKDDVKVSVLATAH
jgi:hypothetical protein